MERAIRISVEAGARVQIDAAEGRRERKKREVRERISEAARQLFLEHGFEATTVEQIARSADVAQATFFNYFPSKSAVLGEMTSEVFERIEELVNELLARPATAQDRIGRFADAVATAIEQTRGLARAAAPRKPMSRRIPPFACQSRHAASTPSKWAASARPKVIKCATGQFNRARNKRAASACGADNTRCDSPCALSETSR